jgi:transmembrane sensor
MEYNNQNIEVLIKYLTGSADENERQQVLAWINESQENRHYFEQLKDIYSSAKTVQHDNVYDVDKSWKNVKIKYLTKHYTKIIQESQFNKTQLLYRSVLKYAAIIVLALGIGAALSFVITKNTLNKENIVWNEVQAPLGSKTTLTLSDGTQVCLNAGSKLRYPGVFNASSREVYLDGEGYFKVAKNKKQKFVVRTSEVSITAYGTEFNVKDYSDENKIQATLVEGVISVKKNDTEKKDDEVYLKPNQSVIYVKNKKEQESQKNNKTTSVYNNQNEIKEEPLQLIVNQNIEPVIYTSWKDKNWIIEGETLESLIVKLGRKYNVSIICNAPEIKQYKFTGTLKDETLEQVLNIIKITAPIEYKIKEHTVTLMLNKESIGNYNKFISR